MIPSLKKQRKERRDNMIDEAISNTSNGGYDKEAYKLKKKEQKEKAYKIIDEALDELKTNPQFFKEYIDVQSRFDMYTPRNALLITKQMPEAIQLKTRNDWRDSKISFKTSKPKTMIIIEPGESYINKNGEEITPINAKEVIDISETNSKPNIKNYDKKFILQALLHECPVNVKAVDSLENNKVCEWNQEDKVIYVCRSDEADLIIKSVATELAKVGLVENNYDIDNDKADCIGYMVCKKYGIEAPINSVDNLHSKYSNMENIDVANDLTSMKEVLLDINTRMGRYLEEKRRETKNKEQER